MTTAPFNKEGIKTFMEKNKDFDLKKHRFFPSSDKKTQLHTQLEKHPLAEQLKAAQRLYRLTDELDTVEALYNKGLHSAYQIASIPKKRFVKEYSTIFKANGQTPEEQAKQVWKKALARKTKTMMTYTAIAQQKGAHYGVSRFNNLGTLTDKNFNNLPGYQDLFGDLDFCSCPDCRTIFSPAAYFVDLMRVQDNYIDIDKTADPPPVPLQTRRPDLWELPLSCDNTNKEVPMLEIANKVLLQTLGKKITYETLAGTYYPFNLPFHLPLVKIRTCLDKLNSTLPGLWQNLGLSDNTSVYREELKISPEQWALYSAPVTDAKILCTYYGLDEGSDPVAILADIETFLQKTNLDHTQLNELLFEDLSKDEIDKKLNAAFFINTGIGEPVQIDDKTNKLLNLTLERLDHINRFVRLAQSLHWNFTDLDWALRTIGIMVNAGKQGAPVINNNALPYLAWMKRMQNQNHNVSVNCLCGMIGMIKNSGLTDGDGTDFFQQIFNSPYVPEPPAWPDDSLRWTVPKLGQTEPIKDDDRKIQNALGAALNINQDNLLLLANAVLKAQKITDQQLPLSLENLSILYRLSLLPTLTGLSVSECLTVLSLPGHNTDALIKLAGTSGAGVWEILNRLCRFSQWIKSTDFSIYQLQYLLTGKSNDRNICNQILGADAVTNFINQLNGLITPTLFTDKCFNEMVNTALPEPGTKAPDTLYKSLTDKGYIDKDHLVQKIPAEDEVQTMELPVFPEGTETKNPFVVAAGKTVITILTSYSQKILTQNTFALATAAVFRPYTALASQCCTFQGIVTQQLSPGTLQKIVTSALFPELESTSQQNITDILQKGVAHYYQQQQQTLISQLSGLYNISGQLVPVIRNWGNLHLEDLTETDEIATQLQLLQKLQMYAQLVNTLSLSPAEAVSILEHPEYYGVVYSKGVSASFTITNIQTLYRFKALIKDFNDTENRLIGYFDYVRTNPTDTKRQAELLSELTQWNAGQIQFLIGKLWPEKGNSTNAWGTVTGIALLTDWFQQSDTLNIAHNTLWQIYRLTDDKAPASYNDYNTVANSIWSALTETDAKKTDDLDSVLGQLNEQKRTALLQLVINKLAKDNKQLTITSARDLYEYLLIDVEAGAVVQTSYVKEAISAVQLYIYRCHNHLEAGVTIDPELDQWWEWIASYRVWQANREVFLYPENYIQPELRKSQSPQFLQLINDLQQANLTDLANINTAFNNYMNGFANVANLKIVAAGIADSTEESTKSICLVACTRVQPYTYYYLTGLLTREDDSDRYTSTHWDYWMETGDKRPVGPPSPVFAFGRWYLFWVEQTQSGSESSSGTSANQKSIPTYSAEIKFSYLDFNHNWIAPQTLDTINLGTTPVQKGNSYWDRVYPIYFSSVQLLAIPYGEGQTGFKFLTLKGGTFDQNIIGAFRYASPEPVTQGIPALDSDQYTNNNIFYQYYTPFGKKIRPGSKKISSFSTWFKLNATPTGTDITPIVDAEVGIDSKGQLCVNKTPLADLEPIAKNTWYHLFVCKSPLTLDQISTTKDETPSCILFQGKFYIAWQDKKQNLNHAQLDITDGTIDNIVTLSEQSYTEPNLAVYDNQLYIAWVTPDKNLNYGILDVVNKSVKDKQTFLESVPRQIPGMASFNNKLYLAWHDKENNILYSHIKSKDEPVKTDAQSEQNVSLCEYQGKLVIAWNNSDISSNNLNIGYIVDETKEYTEVQGKLAATVSINNYSYPSLTTCYDQFFVTWFDDDHFIHYASVHVIDLEYSLRYEKTIPRKSYSIHTFAVGPQPYLLWNDDKHVLLDSANPNIYLNGKGTGFGDISFIAGKFALGYDSSNETKFKGVMQETLLFNRTLSGSEVKGCYEESKNRVTRDFEAYVSKEHGFSVPIPDTRPVLNQPNWYTVEKDNAEFLVLPYISADFTYLSCLRLNTTAVQALSSLLMQLGIDKLLSVGAQMTPEISFEMLAPDVNVIPQAFWPANTIDFLGGTTSNYYWEAFFYAPFLVARELQIQQQFESSKKWYEYIFNPTILKRKWDMPIEDKDENDKYWRFLGLRSYNNPVLKTELSETWTAEVQQDLSNQSQLYEYHNDPFDPHAIARLRPIAYQKSLVMHYIDTMLNWGDNLFRLYTVESIVEATMLYVMAYDLMGKQPVNLGPCTLPETLDIKAIAQHFKDNVGNIPEFLIQLEQSIGIAAAITTVDTPHNDIPGDYFGLPENNRFIGYWDTIRMRLFNIRHGLNIDGVEQKLSLFEPPVEPMQLVRQIASGAGIGQALASLQTAIPYYRFEVMIGKAKEVVQTVIQIGQSLLAALDKKDAEQLSLLQNKNQQDILSLTSVSRQEQLEETDQNINALVESMQNADDRLNHYKNLLDKGWSGNETAQIKLLASSAIPQIAALELKGVSIISYLLPNIFGLANGGMKFGDAANQGASMAESGANILSTYAGIAGTVAGFNRRKEDWKLQETLAQDDVTQIRYQIEAAKCQKKIAKQEITILGKNLEQEQKTENFLKTKFTSQQLYQWMTGKLSALYFQAYQLSYELAIRAQAAWQFERGNTQTFIHSGYWDNLYQGLTAGEALQLDLQKMENAYRNQNKRCFEIVKTISLSRLDPKAFLDLKNTGACRFDLCEADFDYDYPGHYCRQIKTISLSLPVLIGPYQNIHATLTQTANKTLLQTDEKGIRYLLTPEKIQPDTGILRVDTLSNQQIALSQGINDSGLFQLDFNDERYLPFEGTGAVSSWKLEIPLTTNSIDFDSLADVIIQVQYTAVPGSNNFRQLVQSLLPAFSGYRVFSIEQEFSFAWKAFIEKKQALAIPIEPAQFRRNLKSYTVTNLYLQLVLTAEGKQKAPTLEMPELTFLLKSVDDSVQLMYNDAGGIISASLTLEKPVPITDHVECRITVKKDTGGLMRPEYVGNMMLVVSYGASFPSN